MRKVLTCIATFVVLVTSTTEVRAIPIAIVNAGFENPPLADNLFTDNAIPGWTGTDSGESVNFGVFNPPTSFFPAQAPEGQNVAYIERGAVFQTLADALTPGDYTLTVQVGGSLVDPDSPFTVQLRAGSTVLAQASTPAPVDGTFTLVTVNYTAGVGDPLLGQALEIRLIDNLSDKSTEAYFDAVQLNFTPSAVVPPVADAGPDQTVTEGAPVTLDGTGSVDPDGGPQPLGFAWVQVSGQVLALAGADTARPTFTAPPVRDGAHTLVFRVTVSDGALSATDTVSVVVQALPASPLGCVPVRPRPGTLWPPNHQLVPVVLMWTAVETPATVTILGVTQDEPTEGTGDGDTAPDAEGLQGNQVHLRAERAGGGNGRFYHITFRAERGAESCVGQVQVVVPPNLGRTTRPVDDGPRFDSATGAPLP